VGSNATLHVYNTIKITAQLILAENSSVIFYGNSEETPTIIGTDIVLSNGTHVDVQYNLEDLTRRKIPWFIMMGIKSSDRLNTSVTLSSQWKCSSGASIIESAKRDALFVTVQPYQGMKPVKNLVFESVDYQTVDVIFSAEAQYADECMVPGQYVQGITADFLNTTVLLPNSTNSLIRYRFSKVPMGKNSYHVITSGLDVFGEPQKVRSQEFTYEASGTPPTTSTTSSTSSTSTTSSASTEAQTTTSTMDSPNHAVRVGIPLAFVTVIVCML